MKIDLGNIIMVLLGSMILSSCANSEFACNDARGAGCTSIERVYELIQSGEIDEYTEAKDKKCRGKNCKARRATDADREIEHYLGNLTEIEIKEK